MIFVFGDSFAKIFSLINDNVVKVHSFKGATLKGITKSGNKNRNEIELILSKNKNIQYAVFVFGQVDLNLSFYYDKVKTVMENTDASIPSNIFDSHYFSCIKNYINWITNLPGKFKRIILGVYPSPLDQEYTINSLINYGSLNKEEIEINRQMLEYYSSELLRKNRYFEFTYTMKTICNSLKSNNNYHKFYHSNIEYFDLNSYLLDEKLEIKKEYIDISKYNMHIRWEPIIPLLIKELKNLGVNISSSDIVKNIDELESSYLKRKSKNIDDKKYLDRFLI